MKCDAYAVELNVNSGPGSIFDHGTQRDEQFLDLSLHDVGTHRFLDDQFRCPFESFASLLGTTSIRARTAWEARRLWWNVTAFVTIWDR
jgi:hypothetical protein